MRKVERHKLQSGGDVQMIKRTAATLLCFLFPLFAQPTSGKTKNSLGLLPQPTGFFHIYKNGRLVINPQFNSIGDFRDGLVRVEIKGKWGYIDTTGEMRIELEFDNTNDFSEGLAAVKLNGKWGYIDATGNMIISPRFDNALPCSYDTLSTTCAPGQP
jgi:hypothetical protein